MTCDTPFDLNVLERSFRCPPSQFTAFLWAQLLKSMGLKRSRSAKGCEGNLISCIVYILSFEDSRRIRHEFHEIPENICVYSTSNSLFYLYSLNIIRKKLVRLCNKIRYILILIMIIIFIFMFNYKILHWKEIKTIFY